MTDFEIIGYIKTALLENEFGKLKNDILIVTDERVSHIRERHPEDYVFFKKYSKTVIENPDVIIKDLKNENTVFMVGKISGINLNIVVKLILSIENSVRLNSIMTFYRIRDKNLIKLEKKNKVLYKKE